jgi:hypothetical protein
VPNDHKNGKLKSGAGGSGGDGTGRRGTGTETGTTACESGDAADKGEEDVTVSKAKSPAKTTESVVGGCCSAIGSILTTKSDDVEAARVSAAPPRDDGDGVRRVWADGTDEAIGEAKATVGLGRTIDDEEDADVLEDGAKNETGEDECECVVGGGGECVNRVTDVGRGDTAVLRVGVTAVVVAAVMVLEGEPAARACEVAIGENKLTDACAAVGNKGTRAVKSTDQFDDDVLAGGTARVKVAEPSSK